MLLPRMLPALTLCVALPAWADKRLDEASPRPKPSSPRVRGMADGAVKIVGKAASRARDPEAQLATPPAGVPCGLNIFVIRLL